MSDVGSLPNVITRAIDALVKFEVELKFAYFFEDPSRAAHAATNIVEAKQVLQEFLTELIEANPPTQDTNQPSKGKERL